MKFAAFQPPHGHPKGPGEPVVSHRAKVNKRRSARQFQHNTSQTKAANFEAGPMRGGWRL